MDDRSPDTPAAWNMRDKLWLSAILFGILFFAIISRYVWAIISVPTDDEAFRLSILAFEQGRNVVKIRRSECSMTGRSGLGWSVNCPGIYFSQSLGCREVSWEVNAWGTPTDFDGRKGSFNTIMDECRAKTP